MRAGTLAGTKWRVLVDPEKKNKNMPRHYCGEFYTNRKGDSELVYEKAKEIMKVKKKIYDDIKIKRDH